MVGRRTLTLLAVVGACCATAAPSVAAAADREHRQLHATAPADSEGTSPRAVAADTRRVRLSTSDSQFDRGVDNQGWWATSFRASDRNSNYFVGACLPESDCTNGPDVERLRNFFTFDLAAVERRVVGATLVLRRYRGDGNFTERLGLFDVRTPARQLNDNRGVNVTIYRDLGRGDAYGRFLLPTDGDRDGLVRMRLNRAAVRDINQSRGGFFSVGGSLQSVSPDGPAEQHLFGFSRSRGAQDLVLHVEND